MLNFNLPPPNYDALGASLDGGGEEEEGIETLPSHIPINSVHVYMHGYICIFKGNKKVFVRIFKKWGKIRKFSNGKWGNFGNTLYLF